MYLDTPFPVLVNLDNFLTFSMKIFFFFMVIH